ncbi:MAG: tetratricopeptide repeat protein [Candidatus Omnitrophica bacterium]|nr:tetratricopeptide repeat protein [Candidatus Omnitrophota bacterium]
MKRFLAILFFSVFLSLPAAHGQTSDAMQEQARQYREAGYRHQSAGDLQRALQYYQKAVQMDPTYAEVVNDLGVVYEAMGDLGRAEELYKKTLTIDSSYLPAYTNLAFLYEKKGDVTEATYYWKKRYELGNKGEYWREVARQHLLRLGTYPQIRQEMLEKKAARLSKEMVYQREQKRLQRNQEAKLHYDIGTNLVINGDYSQALKEFRTALATNPPDKELMEKITDAYQKTERIYIREQALHDTEEALNSIKDEDFLAAGEKLKDALSAVFRIAREEQ